MTRSAESTERIQTNARQGPGIASYTLNVYEIAQRLMRSEIDIIYARAGNQIIKLCIFAVTQSHKKCTVSAGHAAHDMLEVRVAHERMVL